MDEIGILMFKSRKMVVGQLCVFHGYIQVNDNGTILHLLFLIHFSTHVCALADSFKGIQLTICSDVNCKILV